MRGLLAEYDQLAAAGAVGRAVVTRVWGSAPRPEGACLLATLDGRMAGSVSGGCVETAAAEEIRAAISRGTAKTAGWGVTHERAWEMGLSCGGTIEVLVEPAVRADVLAAARSSSGSVVVSVLKGAVTPSMESRIADASADALGRLTSRVEVIESPDGPVELFLEVFPPRPTLLIFGGVHIAMALARMGKALGYRTIVADGRDAFLTRERFPDADELILGWPEEVFRRTGLDAATCVCLLTHDPKFDEPALQLALRSPAGYIGAIGSRKTQGLRREQLRAAGFGEDDIARLHGPIGLDLGGRSPEEIALAILAEITAVRYGRSEARRG